RGRRDGLRDHQRAARDHLFHAKVQQTAGSDFFTVAATAARLTPVIFSLLAVSYSLSAVCEMLPATF
ncbi:MAG TPA: hypothetical protein VL241_02190, partial [Gemmatimonadales bacterium]|nr:hypothetical protein [Gemmatimonadales bacterium]